MVQVALAHVAAGCTAATNALSVAVGNASPPSACGSYCAAFISKNVVCLLQSSVEYASHSAPLKVVETLKHQEATTDTTRLTSVRLQLHDQSSDIRVIAGDSQGRVFVWTRASEGPWKVQTLQDTEPTLSVAAVAIAETKERKNYVAAFSDGSLAVYEEKKREKVTLLRRLELGRKSIMETVTVTVVGDQVLLAAGGVDGKVHLFEVTDTVTKLLELEGHTDWIRSLAFDRQKTDVGEVVTLASASQDQRIRLWRITTRLKDATATSGEVQEGFLAHGCNFTYTVSFDALLVGHEDWVTSVQWMDNGSSLLSSSMDNTLIVWTTLDDQSGAWSPSLRVGEMGGNGLLAAGVLPARDGRLNLISLGFGGQLERWGQQPAPSKLFLPAIAVNGHCAEVTDLSWSPKGDYLASVSLDQTTRILAPLNVVEGEDKCTQKWYEISRAQVHGYDINCGCFVLGVRPANDLFVSGADEKILRVFEAPDEVKELVDRLKSPEKNSQDTAERTRTVQHAYLPELSLTNKSESSSISDDGYAKLSNTVALPVGDRLSRKTLWPEQRKLYGHGNELLSVTSSHAGDLIASACKSREEKYAAVRLWHTTDWSEAQPPLEGHKSSVVQLAFSPNDQFLLSVSRDRHLCLYDRQDADQKFTLVEHVKAHKRIIWSCSWSPDSRIFALGSRDQSVSLWSQTGGKWTRVCDPITFDAAVTAVGFAPYKTTETNDLLAVGLETGDIQFFAISRNGAVVCTPVGDIPWVLSPSAAVSRLAWRPTSNEDYVLAAASRDNSVRVYNVEV